MTTSNEIGKAKITVEADISGLKRDAADARKEVESVGDAGAKAGAQIGSAFESAGTAIESKTIGIRKFTGAISSAVGAVTGLIGVVGTAVAAITLLSRIFGEAKDKGEEFAKEMNSIAEAIEDYDKAANPDLNLRRRHDLEDQIRASKHLSSFRKQQALEEVRDIAARNKYLDELQKREDMRLKSLEAQRDVLAQIEERRRATVESLLDVADANRISLLPTDEQIKANAEKQKQALIDAAEAASLEASSQTVKLALDSIDQLAQKQIDAVREQERLKDEAQAKRDAASAKRLKDAAERAAEAFSERLNATAGQNLTTRLDTIVARFDELISVNGRR